MGEAPAPLGSAAAPPAEAPSAVALAIPGLVEELLVRLPRWSVVRGLLRLWFVQLTAPGRAVASALAATGSVSLGLGIQFPMHYFALWLTALLAVCWVVAIAFRPRLRVERRFPIRCAAGALLRISARLRNLGRLPAFDLGLRERARPRPFVPLGDEPLDRLGPGEDAELVYRVRAPARGLYELLPCEITSTFPLGLYRMLRKVPGQSRVVVYPAFVPLARLDLPAGRKHQPGGVPLLSEVGDSAEFAGNRDYRPGDPLRNIDHRAWARVGHPVVREYQQEYLARVALVVDTYVVARGHAGVRQLEAAISLGAAIADALGRAEHVVELFAAGPELYCFESGRSLAVLDDVLDVLACIEPCRRDPFGELTPALLDRIDRISAAVVVLLDWDESRRGLVRQLVTRGVRCKVVVVKDGALEAGEAGLIQLGPAEVERGVEVL